MNNYELMFIVKPDVSDDSFNATLSKVNQLVADNGGEVGKAEPWGRRKLAYPIKNIREGQYALMQFKMTPDKTAILEQGLKLNEDIIRYLLVKTSA